MASIEKLLLRGIRSFGPDNEDEAKLKFCSPVTIILGQNGCGKTTIIEALKYATCGEFPGNCSQGSGFVHDPKLCNSTEVSCKEVCFYYVELCTNKTISINSSIKC